ncbi:hypothetical protein JCM10207_000203 [Rhodosporidiobolus poonsookiae]
MPPPAPSAHLARLLTRTALPLLPAHGFRASTLQLASLSLPAPYTPAEPYPPRTLHALYPSSPASSAGEGLLGDFSLKGLLIGNGGRRSRSRQELIALARGQGTATAQAGGERERTGPARALVDEWMREGRRRMVDAVRESGVTGEKAYRLGVEERLRFNAEVGLDRLPEALALLSAPRTTPLSSPAALLPLPSPAAHLAHVAAIAQVLAKAAGSEAQGTAWYALRLRLAAIYTLSELSLLSPSLSSASSEEKLAVALQTAKDLFDRSLELGNSVEDAQVYAGWVGKSWKGLAGSLGV